MMRSRWAFAKTRLVEEERADRTFASWGTFRK